MSPTALFAYMTLVKNIFLKVGEGQTNKTLFILKCNINMLNIILEKSVAIG